MPAIPKLTLTWKTIFMEYMKEKSWNINNFKWFALVLPYKNTELEYTEKMGFY